jgi:hypothetical protein
MNTYRTIVLSFLLVSISPAEDLFKAVRISPAVWEVIFPDKIRPYGGRYLVKIDDTARGISGFGQLLILNTSEVLHLTERHSGMDIRPAEKDGKKGIEITSHWIDRLTGKKTERVTFEAEHEEDPKAIPQVDPVATRAWGLAKSHIENGEKDKALEALAFLQKYLSPILTKADQAGADQPASKPADKPPTKDQPPTPTSKDGPR